MPNSYKCTDLAPEERAVVERLLGRPLQSDDAVEVIAHKSIDSQAVPGEPWESLDRIREFAKAKMFGGATVREWIDEGRHF
ncbi:MAG TPA: hypothetical protein VKJ01_14250 [Candidatus Solibacter sp.]|jgi:hypothetical protein|nr:hypothetical protein [Candidatus Solibacter sp.]